MTAITTQGTYGAGSRMLDPVGLGLATLTLSNLRGVDGSATAGLGGGNGGNGTLDGVGLPGDASTVTIDGDLQVSGPVTIPDGKELVIQGSGGHGKIAGGGGGQATSHSNNSGSGIVGTLSIGAASVNTTLTVDEQTITVHKGSDAVTTTPGAGGTGAVGSITGLDENYANNGDDGSTKVNGGSAATCTSCTVDLTGVTSITIEVPAAGSEQDLVVTLHGGPNDGESLYCRGALNGSDGGTGGSFDGSGSGFTPTGGADGTANSISGAGSDAAFTVGWTLAVTGGGDSASSLGTGTSNWPGLYSD
jgi:hypothetical protein